MGEAGDFSLMDFEACFKVHKDNEDGLVTKAEMIEFIKKVVGVTDGNWPYSWKMNLDVQF